MADAAAGASAPSAVQDTTAPTENPTAAPAVADDIPPWKKVKHKIKVDQQEAELDYDELVRRAQKGTAADKRLAEAAALRKQLESTWNATDPTHFFKSRNLDPEQWAEQLLIKKLKLQNMSPEERAAHEKGELERAEREREKAEIEQLRQEKQQMLTQQVVQRLDQEITDAFKAIGRTPTPAVVKRMAELMDMHMETHDGEFMPAAKALEIALSGRQSDAAEYLQSLTAEQLRQILPKKLLDDLRRQDVELVRSQSPLRTQKTNGASQPSTPAVKKRISTEEAFRKLEEKLSS